MNMLTSPIPSLISKLILMALRGMSMFSKLLLLIVMGRYLAIEDIGFYGLVLGAGTIYAQMAGWGFGFHLNRYMITSDTMNQRKLFSHQWGLFLYTYLITILLCIPLFFLINQTQTHIDFYTAILIIAIILGEHATFEITRLLISVKRAMEGNILFFLRTAGWTFPIAGGMFVIPEMRSLDVILTSWAFFNILAFIIGLWWCRGYIEVGKSFLLNFFIISPEWIRKNITSSLLVYASFTANAISMYINRFTVGAFLGINEAGLFTIYWTIVNAIYMLAQTGFIQTSYPAMIEARRDPRVYHQQVILLYKQTIIFSILSGLAIGFGGPLLFELMGQKEATDNLPLFYALLLCGIVKLMATVAFYSLNYHHDDRELMNGMALTLALGIPVSIISVMTLGLWGAVVAEGFFAISMLTILVLIYQKVRRIKV